MKVCALTCTCGRHTCIERSIRLFLDQDYDDCIQLVFQNSPVTQQLIPGLENIILINQSIDSNTGESFKNLGDIYNNALKHIPDDVDIVTMWDDDDLFLPNHISEGVKGLIRSGKTAYKPYNSYYRSGGSTSLVHNTLEPSIFVWAAHIKKYGFTSATHDQHMGWLDPLIKNKDIHVDPKGVPTLIYMWGEAFPVFKTSGNPSNPDNFKNYRKSSADHGDRVITPISTEKANRYLWPTSLQT